MGFTIGVDLGSSTRNQILNLTSSANSADGIIVGVRSLVKGCVVEDNGVYGILIGEFGQVQDCTITGHDRWLRHLRCRPPVGQGQ